MDSMADTSTSYRTHVASTACVAPRARTTHERLDSQVAHELVPARVDTLGTQRDLFRLVKWGVLVSTETPYSIRRRTDALDLNMLGVEMQKATAAQQAAVSRFLELAKRVTEVQAVYAKLSDDRDALIVWAAVPEWSWQIADTVATMALQATESDPAVSVVFDMLVIGGWSNADVRRVTASRDRVYVRQ